MPLPRIHTRLNLETLEKQEKHETQEFRIRPRYLPDEVVENIVGWYKEFERARIKAYHYERFMKSYATSLFKSSSRLMLYNRELKALGMKYRTLGEPPTFKQFVYDSKRCGRQYNYMELKGIFF